MKTRFATYLLETHFVDYMDTVKEKGVPDEAENYMNPDTRKNKKKKKIKNPVFNYINLEQFLRYAQANQE